MPLSAADEGDGHVRVAVETDRGVLVVEAGGSGELVEHVGPFFGKVERGVHDGEGFDGAHVLEVAQPVSFVFVQLVARPFDARRRPWD